MGVCVFAAGHKQSGEELNDVILPPWAKGDPREFIRVQREVSYDDSVPASEPQLLPALNPARIQTDREL